jgi:hypothetical protein
MRRKSATFTAEEEPFVIAGFRDLRLWWSNFGLLQMIKAGLQLQPLPIEDLQAAPDLVYLVGCHGLRTQIAFSCFVILICHTFGILVTLQRIEKNGDRSRAKLPSSHNNAPHPGCC